MNTSANYNSCVLSIAGFDPSAGAGVLADVKTFEQCGIYGMGVVSALTFQNDISFEKVEWLKPSQIIEQIEVLQKRFHFDYIKIGLIENLEVLLQLVSYFRSISNHKHQAPRLIWDPILKASAGFEFHNSIRKKTLEDICSQIYLLTPNLPEVLQLVDGNDAEENAKYLSRFCNVFLKGGHNSEKVGHDILFTKEGSQVGFPPMTDHAFVKHGSGCVLSSAITANLAIGHELKDACFNAKKYITKFLMSNESILGNHTSSTKVKI